MDRGKPGKLPEDISVKHAHDGTGELVKSSASTHIVKEQFVPAEHRDIASFNADNEFNRAIDKENIDFNIPGVPNATVKRSHGINVHNLIQKIENHPQRPSTSRWSSTTSTHSTLSAKNQKMRLQLLGTLNCAKYSMLNLKHNAKACLAYWGRWHRLLHVRALLTRWYDREQEVHQVRSWSLSLSRTFTSGRADHTVTGTERKKVIENTTLQINSKRSVRNDNSWAFTIGFIRDTWVQKKPCWNWVALKKWSARWDKLANEDHTHIATEEETQRKS